MNRLKSPLRPSISDSLDSFRSARDLRIHLTRNGAKTDLLRSFLDLGCGLDHQQGRHPDERHFSPSLCQEACRNAWDVTGLDYGQLSLSVDWSFVQGDITQITPDHFGGKQFDWVNSTRLISVRQPNFISPGLSLPSGLRPYEAFKDPEDLLHPEYLSLVRRVFRLVGGVLHEGGVFTLNDRDVYLKEGGELVHAMGAGGVHLDPFEGNLVNVLD